MVRPCSPQAPLKPNPKGAPPARPGSPFTIQRVYKITTPPRALQSVDARRNMATQRLISGTFLCAVSLLTRSASAQRVFESQRVRFQTEVVATGLKQPSAMVF